MNSVSSTITAQPPLNAEEEGIFGSLYSKLSLLDRKIGGMELYKILMSFGGSILIPISLLNSSQDQQSFISPQKFGLSGVALIIIPTALIILSACKEQFKAHLKSN